MTLCPPPALPSGTFLSIQLWKAAEAAHCYMPGLSLSISSVQAAQSYAGNETKQGINQGALSARQARHFPCELVNYFRILASGQALRSPTGGNQSWLMYH